MILKDSQELHPKTSQIQEHGCIATDRYQFVFFSLACSCLCCAATATDWIPTGLAVQTNSTLHVCQEIHVNNLRTGLERDTEGARLQIEITFIELHIHVLSKCYFIQHITHVASRCGNQKWISYWLRMLLDL